MTAQEKALLLTVARVLRAKTKEEIYAEREGDLFALNEALSPFESTGPAGDAGQVGWMGGEFDR